MLFLKLLMINTDCTKSYHLTELIQTKSSHLGFYEAFLEAGPQFALQLGNIIRLGFFSMTNDAHYALKIYSAAHV